MPSSFDILAKRVFPDFNTRLKLRVIAGWPMDALDILLRRRSPLVPARGLWFIGGGKNYPQISESAFAYLTAAGLKPEHSVLDMGCGIGFTARRFTNYITSGSYDGFDVIRVAIDWASSHISKRCPNFRFKHVDVFSRHYNPHGKIQPAEFTFPYESSTFDFIFGLSLFTHLLPDASQRYLQEMNRVMKPGATAWISTFLINDESAALLRAGKSFYPMSPSGDSWLMDPDFPETAVGHVESDFRRACALAGLEIHKIQPGSWCGRSEYVSGQDHVILKKITQPGSGVS